MKKFIPVPLFASVFIFLFFSYCAAALPGVKSALMLNMDNGAILYQLNPDTPVAPASLTKIMTMFLTLDAVKAKKLSLNQKINISKSAANAGGSAMRLNPGEKVPVVRLLAGMAVASGNDAATALAQHVGGNQDKFVSRMNSKAARLGMKNTKFKNPTGLPAAGQKTTARDLAALCRAYLKTHPQAARFHNMKYFMHKGAVARNTNPLLGRVSGVNGLKTGWTIASGYNLIITAKRNNAKLLVIILGAQSKEARDQAAMRLLEAGFKAPASPARVATFMKAK